MSLFHSKRKSVTSSNGWKTTGSSKKSLNRPTDWCAPMVPVIKPNGSVRICVDLKRLNSHVKCAHYPLPAVENTLARLAKSKVFSTLDTNSEFWQIPLSPDSARLTTFITPLEGFTSSGCRSALRRHPRFFNNVSSHYSQTLMA